MAAAPFKTANEFVIDVLVQWPSPYGVTAAKILRAEGRDPQARQKTKMTNLLNRGSYKFKKS